MRLADWSLDPRVVHLNHGSYGGCPRAVTDAAAAIRDRLDRAPMQFFVLEWQPAIDHARSSLATFLHTDPARLIYVPNATTGIAIALRSCAPITGAILTTDHTYRACKNQLDRTGARIDVVAIPLPFDPARLLDDVRRAIRPDTTIAVLDHITSPTALILPIAEILAELRGIITIVDGAHAPGQVPLDLTALGATYYVGTCHKWLCAPKGSAFLAIGPSAPFRPIVTSHGASPEYGPENRLHAELDWMGTHDPSPYLATPTALAAFDWPTVMRENHAKVLAMRDRLGVQAIAPDLAIGSMLAFPLDHPIDQAEILRAGIEVPIIPWTPRPLMRISAHLYNDVSDVDALQTFLLRRC